MRFWLEVLENESTFILCRNGKVCYIFGFIVLKVKEMKLRNGVKEVGDY